MAASCAQHNAAAGGTTSPCAGAQLVYVGATASYSNAVSQWAARGGAGLLGASGYTLCGGATAATSDGRWVVVVNLG